MTKLISGRVPKIPSANVRADRYEFLEISEAEPDLGLPPNSGYVLTSNIQGVRSWVNSVEFSGVANVSIFSGRANVATLADVANVSLYTNLANISLSANVANTVLSLSNFSTANLTEGINLYFTNARVISAITPLLTTSNVIEGTNQYFTNARTLIGITTGTVQGNIIVTDTISSNKLVSNTITVGAGTGGSLTGANLISATYIQSTNWLGLYTSNVIEGTNLYYTNARVISAVTPLLTTANVTELNNFYFTNARVISAVTPLLTTSNVIEGTNLYYTNARVISAVTPLLTTSNVIEGTNLYYTDARVLANVAQMSVNVFADVDITGILNNGVLLWNGTKFVAGTIDTGATANIALFAEVANTVLTLNNFTTANLAEGTNLYFTNARSVGSLIAGQNITIEANGRISANLTATLANISTVIDNLTTDGIAEGAVNLYYTNSRVRSTLSGGTGVIYDSSSGVISIGQNVAAEASVVFKNLTLNGNLYVLGNLVSVFANTLTISDPIIQLGYGNPSDSYDLGFVGHYNDGVERHTGLFRDHNDGKFKLFDNLTPEPGLINVDTSNVSFRYASLVVSTLEGNVTGTVGTLSNFTTANLKESASNLYYTNDRVVTAVIPLLTTSNVIEGTNLYFTAARVNATVQPFLTTANVIETSGNLYFTSARVNATVQPFLTTANVIETSGNLYFTNARVVSALIAGQNITIEANGRISANNTSIASLNLTTADVRETTNLYYTDTRVNTFVQPFLTTANVIETSSNLYFTTARVNATVQPFLTTANVIETSGNLYFTNTRVVSALIAGDSITIEANGRISANISVNTSLLNLTTADVRETSNLYFTNTRVVTAVTPLLTTANVIETSANLYFTNARVLSALTGNVTIGNLLTTGQIVVTAPGSAETGAGQIYLNGATNNRIDWAAVGTGSPTFTTRSDGTKVVLYPSIGGSTVDYAMGIDAATMWSSVPEYGDSFKFKWYGATTEIASLTGTGTFTVKTIQANVWNGLYTSNVIETSSNLYFTNTRVFNAVTIGTITGDIAVTGNLVANGLVIQGINVTQTVLAGNVVSTGTSTSNIIVADSITSNTWNRLYTANVIETSGNLYFTNSRVVSALVPGNNITIESNGRISASVSLGSITTADVSEVSSNLYFTNTRAISAFTAGKGIVISGAGLITATSAPYDFNTAIDGTQGYLLTGNLVPVVKFNGGANDRFILRSLHITNISGSTAYITANVGYLATGNSVALAKLIPVPAGSVLEFLKKPQVFSSNDSIGLQSFNNSILPASNVLSAIFTYESVASDPSYNGVGTTIIGPNTDAAVFQSSQSAAVVVSIKIVNSALVTVPVKATWVDANNVIKSYFSYDFNIPPNSSVELLQYPKRMERSDKILVSYPTTIDVENTDVSCFVSYRYLSTTSIASYTAAADTSAPITTSFDTSEIDGTTLYYSIQ